VLADPARRRGRTRGQPLAERLPQLVGNALAMRLALGDVVVALAAAASGLPAYGPDVRTAS
jgi:enoyl-CoA hydratase/carnithine racemase